MTRKITLTLADDTDATKCGSCALLFHGRDKGGAYRSVCGVYAGTVTAGKRLPECIAASEAHAAMERDARNAALGAKVRAVLPRHVRGEEYESQASIVQGAADLFGNVEVPWHSPIAAAVFGALAAALREEADRG